jgi:hypothetical protein
MANDVIDAFAKHRIAAAHDFAIKWLNGAPFRRVH